MTDRVISTHTSTPTVYHTRDDCPHYPDDVREYADCDARRNLRKCSYCRSRELGDVLELE